MDLFKTVLSTQVLLVILSREIFDESRTNIMKTVVKKDGDICYVTINKPCIVLHKQYSELLPEGKKIVYIDATPGAMATKNDSIDCSVTINSPANLNDINMEITKLLGNNSFETMIFDSVDTLEIYNDFKIVTQFIHSLIGKIRAKDKNIILFGINDKQESTIIKELFMFVDNTMHLSYSKGSILTK